jgi:hypothetical protein
MAFWFNVNTKQVETDETRSEAVDVLGPYPTREAAARALETARERTKAWEADEAEDEDDDTDD